MFKINVEQYRWLLGALAAGIVLTVMTILVYFALWRKRMDVTTEEDVMRGSFTQWLMAYIPWVLLLTFLGVAAFGIAYTIRSIMNTPNW